MVPRRPDNRNKQHSSEDDGDDLRISAAERREHVASIRRIPDHLLASDAARAALIALADAGYDCYAYASGGERLGTWCVWISELARVRPDKNGRIPVREWAIHWRAILKELAALTPAPAPRPVAGWLARHVERTLGTGGDDDDNGGHGGHAA